MKSNTKKDKEVLYIDVDEFFKGKGIESTIVEPTKKDGGDKHVKLLKTEKRK